MQCAPDVGPGLVQLEVEDDRGIQIAFAFDDRPVGIDPQEVVRGDLVPEHANAGDDQCAVLPVADAEVPGELVVVALLGEGAAGDRHLLPFGECGHGVVHTSIMPSSHLWR